MADAPPNWKTCQIEADCIGLRIADDGGCLRHCREEQRQLAFAMVASGGDLNVARGVSIDGDLLERLLAHLPVGPSGERLIRGCDFRDATFEAYVGFRNATFEGDASFNFATFGRYVRFMKVTFKGRADFQHAIFQKTPEFVGI